MVTTCIKCEAYGPTDGHHVTYTPEQVVRLCRSCHELITALNFLWSQQVGRLTNKERQRIWTVFLQLPLRDIQLMVARIDVKKLFKRRGIIHKGGSNGFRNRHVSGTRKVMHKRA